jgi:hypothetical protein
MFESVQERLKQDARIAPRRAMPGRIEPTAGQRSDGELEGSDVARGDLASLTEPVA